MTPDILHPQPDTMPAIPRKVEQTGVVGSTPEQQRTALEKVLHKTLSEHAETSYAGSVLTDLSHSLTTILLHEGHEWQGAPVKTQPTSQVMEDGSFYLGGLRGRTLRHALDNVKAYQAKLEAATPDVPYVNTSELQHILEEQLAYRKAEMQQFMDSSWQPRVRTPEELQRMEEAARKEMEGRELLKLDKKKQKEHEKAFPSKLGEKTEWYDIDNYKTFHITQDENEPSLQVYGPREGERDFFIYGQGRVVKEIRSESTPVVILGVEAEEIVINPSQATIADSNIGRFSKISGHDYLGADVTITDSTIRKGYLHNPQDKILHLSNTTIGNLQVDLGKIEAEDCEMGELTGRLSGNVQADIVVLRGKDEGLHVEGVVGESELVEAKTDQEVFSETVAQIQEDPSVSKTVAHLQEAWGLENTGNSQSIPADTHEVMIFGREENESEKQFGELADEGINGVGSLDDDPYPDEYDYDAGYGLDL